MRFFERLSPSRDLLAIPSIRRVVLARLFTNLFFYSTTIVLFQQQRGLNFTAMFLMESILSGAILVADVPTSIWADRFGYRRMIILGCLCGIVGMICFALAYGFWMFAVSNVIGGFSIACSSGCESALVYSSLTPELREKRGNAAFTLLSMASTCGFFVGLATGSFIGAYSPTLAVVMSIVPLVCALFAAWRIPEQQVLLADSQAKPGIGKIVKTALRTIRHQPVLIGLKVFSSATFSLTNAIFWFNQPYFERAGIPVAWFGPLMAMAIGLQFLALLRLTRFLQHLGTRQMLILSCLLPGLAYILLTRTAQPLLTVAFVASIVAFSAWQDPLVNNLLNKRVKDELGNYPLSSFADWLFHRHSIEPMDWLAWRPGSGRDRNWYWRWFSFALCAYSPGCEGASIQWGA